MGFAFEKTNNTKSAEEHFLIAVKIDPNNSYALRNLGGLYGKIPDLEKSIYYLKGLYGQSFRSDDHLWFGICLSAHRRFKSERINYLNSCLELDAPEKQKNWPELREEKLQSAILSLRGSESMLFSI